MGPGTAYLAPAVQEVQEVATEAIPVRSVVVLAKVYHRAAAVRGGVQGKKVAVTVLLDGHDFPLPNLVEPPLRVTERPGPLLTSRIKLFESS
jgi:hypothetical protein